jgi:hypothetical protein
MAITKEIFVVDGNDHISTIFFKIDRAIANIQARYRLTLTVNDVTIDRNPHGKGQWEYSVKAKVNANR